MYERKSRLSDVESEPEAKKNVEEARKELESMGIEVSESFTRVGDPVNEIIEAGPDYSVIVFSESSRTGMFRLFTGSVAYKVMQESYTSVMIVR
ncbi:MAG: universal stress protein [Rhodospirillales bacterium]